MTTKPGKTGATYDDLREVPDHFVAELFDGELYASPRPAIPHCHAKTVLNAELGVPFDRRGPGGWVFLVEPEVHFGNDVLVPDLAAWRRERLPRVPPDDFMTLAPDWACEVLSPLTETLDRGKKLAAYAREGVAHAWLLEPQRQTLEVLRLESGKWIEVAAHEGRAGVRAAPFANPISRARSSYPFVVTLQADVAQDARERAVAPVAPRSAFPAIAGRLTPIMTIERDEFVLLVTSVTTIPAQSLGRAIGSLADRREDILAAIDYLFFGV